MHTSARYRLRHYDLINPEAYKKKIVVVGAGAIGSFVVLALAKMGYDNITVYDDDKLEPENISAQFYPIREIGSLKVDALQRMIIDFSGVVITTHGRRVDKNDTLNADIVISAVDSMEARKLIFEISNCYWLIDPRMGAEYATMRVCDAQNAEERTKYRATLFSDESAVAEACTAKTTIYTVMMIAGQVMKAVKDVTTFTKSPATGDAAIYREPITSLDWNIRDNALIAFTRGRKL